MCSLRAIVWTGETAAIILDLYLRVDRRVPYTWAFPCHSFRTCHSQCCGLLDSGQFLDEALKISRIKELDRIEHEIKHPYARWVGQSTLEIGQKQSVRANQLKKAA